MKHNKYTEQQLREVIASSRSIRQALTKLNIANQGGNYRVIHRAIRTYDIDISHFTGHGWSKGRKIGPKRPLGDYLTGSEEIIISSHKLRLRLIQEKYFSHQCSNCNKKTWLGNAIPLELDHIDGNHRNNKLDNLRLLCPNCHSLTPTYRGRGKKRT